MRRGSAGPAQEGKQEEASGQGKLGQQARLGRRGKNGQQAELRKRKGEKNISFIFFQINFSNDF